jgi:uncharacterized protein with HEPN domain
MNDWTPDQQRAALRMQAAQLREVTLQCDDALHYARERRFEQWRQDTVYPQAVNRWVAAIGEGAR